jgi:hypothetical protein
MSNRSYKLELRVSHTPEEFQITAKPPALLKYWLSTKTELETWEGRNCIYTSVASRDLLEYCKIFENDPLLFPEFEDNPWLGGKMSNVETWKHGKSPSVVFSRLSELTRLQ